MATNSPLKDSRSQPMDILHLTPQLPYPAHQGASLRNFNTLRSLARLHRVTLLSFQEADQPNPDSAGNPLLELCESVHTVPVPIRSSRQRVRRLLFSRLPDMGHRLQSSLFDNQLAELLAANRFAVVQIEGIELARVIPIVRRLSPASKILFDDHNAEAALQQRTFQTDLGSPSRWPAAAYSLIQTRRLRRYEALACQSADWVTVVSDADAHHLRSLVPGLALHVIPNSIDVSEYSGPAPLDAPRHDIVFMGKMDYRPNVDAVLWFGKEIWPQIRSRRPSTSWAIVGQKPHGRLDALRDLPDVTITGHVPQVQPYLAGATLFVMPFRIGSGTRLKLIEALAAGKPVVSTPVGSEGYPVVNGRHLLLADEPADFADAVLGLIEDRSLAEQLGRAGKAFAAQYDWRVIGPLFETVYTSSPNT